MQLGNDHSFALENISDLHTKIDSGYYFFNISNPEWEVSPTQLTPKQRGDISLAALHKSIEFGNQYSGRLCVVTAPIDKFACIEAGMKIGGQTELFSENWHGDSIMLLAGDKLRVGLATNHLPVKEISGALTKQVVAKKAELLALAISDIYQVAQPRVAICGLNPHCGENGKIGREEIDIIEPTIKALSQEYPGYQFSGPHSADGVFGLAVAGKYDGVLAMYHDQGLAPLKTVDFDTAVNITYGLKHLRVSPDHGPAKDIYLQKTASAKSMENAFKIASSYLERPLNG
jgi:4-hydroxythreonine-4-phosphate dehydrogenase